LTVQAPAKINIHLEVKNTRSDGFHSLRSVFLALSFGDTLHFEPLSPSESLEIRMRPVIPIEKNITFKAVSLFRRHTGFNQGLRIRVDKRIPLGGGLGGGSSDAAAALLALNTLATDASFPPLDSASLAALAASLGSDVPFFLNNTGAALVTGRGEIIQPLAIRAGLWIVLVNPGFHSDTGEAFRLLDQFREAFRASEGEFFEHLSSDFSAILDGPPRAWPFTNDFLPVFFQDSGLKAAYSAILNRLKDEGAEFAGLSGAGSSCFGVFSDRKSALKAKNELSKKWNFVKTTFPLAR
jgi:4-diphosphocytidyl-2-C-methyl-D-erythritol kinase